MLSTAIDLTYDGGGIIAIDNGQFGFLRLNNIQNTLSNDLRYVSPPSFKLYNNHPNPFNPELNIDVSIENSGLLNVSVYNINGQHIETIYNDFASVSIFEGILFFLQIVVNSVNILYTLLSLYDMLVHS